MKIKERAAHRLHILEILLLLGTVLFLSSGAFALRTQEDLADKVVRLHVLANSDSEEDQALKLIVRDAVLEKTRTLLEHVDQKEKAEEILREAIPTLEDVARQALQQAGADNTVTVTLGQEEYPTRQYESLAFPAGEYLSLRVMIGEAEGQNWWCVLFPPLCLSAATDTASAEDAFIAVGLTDDQYKIITETDSTTYQVRFKILETIEDTKRDISEFFGKK